MTINLVPLSLPASADTAKLNDFGREVKGLHPAHLATSYGQVKEALYTHGALLFRNVDLTPEEIRDLVKAFDPDSTAYGHGNSKVDQTKTSILHSYLKTIPRVPQVQLIGNGIVRDHEGIPEAVLKHAHHSSFHKTRVSDEDEARGVTRFFRWHMDAALYDLDPPKVTALYGIRVPKGPNQVVRYDDRSGDELVVPLGTTAFVSGKVMFDILPPEMKSVAVRAKAKYAPKPFEWMKEARAVETGLGLESEGYEKSMEELDWDKEKIKIYPFLWKNPMTGDLHLEVHPCAIMEIYLDPVPENARREGVLYPNGAHITDLKEVRKLCHEMQRPGIAPKLVYPHAWQEKDLMLFHNRGVMHSVVGVFGQDQVRVFHQCNLAASDTPDGPNDEDIMKWM
ncbi:Clavaminate synthase-like protein [Guyanagaster necrorhizus]|uniref:Clavaminate synthase-like protein n=1 Tax=Guyanagaster necrorhizus TaxID=856835 RepID=A0A9P7W3M7_9AGAR|nr:Clavaminate synthase-like protein [Guyanagaster necrorhizus MCA 3950]KAG7451825.1 Clavaminate synthase-like protein [Guyanagaster necrorhizus MCA 3950]